VWDENFYRAWRLESAREEKGKDEELEMEMELELELEEW
jgi:hypothetical protein